MTDLTELLRLHAAADIGPIHIGYDKNGFGCLMDSKGATFGEEWQLEDAEWIVAIHNAAPSLLARLEAAEAELARLKACPEAMVHEDCEYKTYAKRGWYIVKDNLGMDYLSKSGEWHRGIGDPQEDYFWPTEDEAKAFLEAFKAKGTER